MISEQLKNIKSTLPKHVKLVAVSKYHPASDVLEAYQAGQRIFGENIAQEIVRKQPELPEDIQWHFIGHLQRNKVKYIAPFIHTIESVDSLRLMKEIEKQAAINNRTIEILIQVYIAEEESKFGWSINECLEFFKNAQYKDYPHLKVKGLMGMATQTEDKDQIHTEFKTLKELFDKIKDAFFKEDASFDTLSMGMSHDYPTAIEEGSTMVRIGTAIFGERKY